MAHQLFRSGLSLAAARKAKQLDVIALSEAVGISFSDLVRLEKGERRPTPELLSRLWSVLSTGETANTRINHHTVRDT